MTKVNPSMNKDDIFAIEVMLRGGTSISMTVTRADFTLLQEDIANSACVFTYCKDIESMYMLRVSDIQAIRSSPMNRTTGRS